jgi:hypothetical protein
MIRMAFITPRLPVSAKLLQVPTFDKKKEEIDTLRRNWSVELLRREAASTL